MTEILIHPITRIEGHLAIRVSIEGERVIDAWVHGTMFRGFEIILVGRDPTDAQFITSRVCGVCSVDHSIAAARNLESAFNINPPPSAIIIRNLIQYAHWIYDHIIHCFILAGPDYGPPHGKIEDLAWMKGKGFIQALKMQRLAMEAAAIFGGKFPHAASIIPGGITETPSIQKITSYIYRVNQLRRWIEDYMMPLFDKFYETYKNELTGLGEREANLIAYGTFEDVSLDPVKRVLKPGVIINGSLVTNNLYDEIEPNIVEYVLHSWFSDDSGGKPSEEDQPKIKYSGLEKNGKYTFIKAPRWKDYVMETGPIARLWSTALQTKGKIIVTNVGEWRPPKRPDTIERVYARAFETAFIAEKAIEEADKLLELIRMKEVETWTPWRIPESSKGKGLVEAARGALGHWITIENKIIKRYQIITPTAWNLSPRDLYGKRGPLEEALLNTNVDSSYTTLNIVRVVRSFDPCLACAVHVYKGSRRVKETMITIKYRG